MRRLFCLLSLCGFVMMPPAGAVTSSLPLLLAEEHKGQGHLAGYLVSEKLDGVRAFWDGEVLRFRSGRSISAPRWFTDPLPRRALDGELWMGRGQFERLSGIIRQKHPDDEAWRAVRYMLFELPGGEGGFAQRAENLRGIAERVGVDWVQAVEQVSLAGADSLPGRLQSVVEAGGEGLMLHRADAPYVTGRSAVLLKLKPVADAEATVIGHVPGKGRHLGRVGALRVRDGEGRIFLLGAGLSDALRNNPPSPGTVVTYRYRDRTARGIPRFASFLRVHEAW